MQHHKWSEHYNSKNTKWDLGRSPVPLQAFIASLPPSSNVLIPGCGRGYEIQEFCAAGHGVTAIDFASGAVEAARQTIGSLADLIIIDDFFAHPLPDKSHDVCYERTFLCALPEALRALYGTRIAPLLKDTGVLVGVFHYGEPKDDGPPDGPPYPMTPQDRCTLLESHFLLIHDSPCPSGLDVFSDHDERWQIWKKKNV